MYGRSIRESVYREGYVLPWYTLLYYPGHTRLPSPVAPRPASPWHRVLGYIWRAFGVHLASDLLHLVYFWRPICSICAILAPVTAHLRYFSSSNRSFALLCLTFASFARYFASPFASFARYLPLVSGVAEWREVLGWRRVSEWRGEVSEVRKVAKSAVLSRRLFRHWKHV